MYLTIAKEFQNIETIYEIINNFKNHFNLLLSDGIITNTRYISLIETVSDIFKKTVETEKNLKLLEIDYNNDDSLLGLKILDNENDDNEKDSIDEMIKKDIEEDTRINNILKSLNDNKMEEIAEKILKIKNELKEIILDYGYISISSVFENILGDDDYKKFKYDIIEKINNLEKYFQIMCVNSKKIDNKEKKEDDIDNLLIINEIFFKIKNLDLKKPVETEQNIFLSNLQERLDLNLIYEVNKAQLEFIINDTVYIFDGYFKEDLFNEIYKDSVNEMKYNQIIRYYDNKDEEEQPENYKKYLYFIKEYLSQLSLKDFFIKDVDEIVKDLKEKYELYIKYSNLTILELVEKFLEVNVYQKRDIVILLLINDIVVDDNKNSQLIIIPSDNNYNNNNSFSNLTNRFNKELGIKEDPIKNVKMNKATNERYILNSLNRKFDDRQKRFNEEFELNSKKMINANVLVDFLRNTIMKSNEYENFYQSIHTNFRKKIFAKNIEDAKPIKQKEEISWEMKLSVLDLTDKAKSKVNEKIRECKGSKDNTKAESYVEEFFKIPFGNFIVEDIFIKCANSYKKINALIKNINKNINNKDYLFKQNDSLSSIITKSMMVSNLDDKKLVEGVINETKYMNNEKNKYMNNVERVLDEAVFGHKDSKREIKRVIAQWMNGKMEGTILGFHGPPGVGKTCFAKKGIAKCLVDSNGKTRPFCLLQLGGASDGAMLEGHSYTYVGAKCGRLVEFLQESKCMNPIIYFDELDKVSHTEKGKEIIDVLIHLTDKSQNKEIYDKYFSGIELDFSKCIIIFSYNDASLVNRILRDRITEIKINPLKKNEKVVITKKYTFKEITEELNFECKMDDKLIEYIIDNYTYEAGVRKLNEKLYEIFREINLRIMENPFSKNKLDKDLIDEILTRHYKVKHYSIHKQPEVGLINGLYASTVGLGGITLIQVKKILTNNNSMPLELTGQQGDVMKESMSCAKTLAMNLLSQMQKDCVSDELKNSPFGLHIHCPDGATPKDGPSAGITITTGIYSVLTNKKIRNDIAMTGEVDLLGNVKAIGGLDAKINGAIKAGVKLVIFPKENEQDMDKIIKEKLLDAHIEYKMVEKISEVIEHTIIKEE